MICYVYLFVAGMQRKLLPFLRANAINGKSVVNKSYDYISNYSLSSSRLAYLYVGIDCVGFEHKFLDGTKGRNISTP